jgi:hypothetical protein
MRILVLCDRDINQRARWRQTFRKETHFNELVLCDPTQVSDIHKLMGNEFDLCLIEHCGTATAHCESEMARVLQRCKMVLRVEAAGPTAADLVHIPLPKPTIKRG